MQTGYVLLATIAVPLFTALALVAVPSRHAIAVRAISVASGFVLFGLSLYAFFAYQLATGEQFQFVLRCSSSETERVLRSTSEPRPRLNTRSRR